MSIKSLSASDIRLTRGEYETAKGLEFTSANLLLNRYCFSNGTTKFNKPLTRCNKLLLI